MKTMTDLTDRFPLQFNVERMREEVRWLENSHNWVSHYDASLADGWTAVPLVSHDGTMDQANSQRLGRWGDYRRTAIVDSLPYFREILDAFQCPHGRIRIMRMNPGTIIRPHRDVFKEVANLAFGQVRLHVPIFTNDKVVFVVGDEPLKLAAGRLYYVNFSKVHYVRNDGSEPRTHLVLDLRVNDWLRNIFPPLTLAERIENRVVRHTLPLCWYGQAASHLPKHWAWKIYNESGLRGLRHKMFPKATLAAERQKQA